MIEHNLTQDELQFMAARLKNKPRKVWHWIGRRDDRINGVTVAMHDGVITEAVADDCDDTARIIRVVHDALVQSHAARSRSAKKAAQKRAERMAKATYEAARRLKQDTLAPKHNCIICGRGLGDDESIQRGIGSECWQRVLDIVHLLDRSAEFMGDSFPLVQLHAVLPDFERFMRCLDDAKYFDRVTNEIAEEASRHCDDPDYVEPDLPDDIKAWPNDYWQDVFQTWAEMSDLCFKGTRGFRPDEEVISA